MRSSLFKIIRINSRLYIFLVVLSLSFGVLQPNHCHSQAAAAGGKRYDLLVYGATPSGILAAVSANERGKTVLLVEPSRHLGGMLTSGLSATDTGRQEYIGGRTREFFKLVAKAYGQQKPRWDFEPKVAAEAFSELLSNSSVELALETQLLSVRTETVTGAGSSPTSRRISSLEVTTKLSAERTSSLQATVYIDATYEGDLLAAAGVPFAVGRESHESYGEPSAGVYVKEAHDYFHQEISGLNPDGSTISGVTKDSPGAVGSGDQAVQAYNFRPCVTKRVENRRPFAPPPGYQATQFELLKRFLAKRPETKFEDLFNLLNLPNGKFDLNNKGPISSDMIGGNWHYPTSTWHERQRIVAEHRDYLQGMLWFLSSDPAVPSLLRQEVSQWGLCRDEFIENNNWPPQLYVREARRMIGSYVLKESDIRVTATKADSVGIGSHPIEAHHVRRYLLPNGLVQNEGFVYLRSQGPKPFEIPYSALLPKSEQCQNLAVPVALSASHVAYGAVRMEPVFMILGESAGIAASLAIEFGGNLHRVEISALQRELVKANQVLRIEQRKS